MIDSRHVTEDQMQKVKDLLKSSNVRYVISRYFILSNVDEIFPFQPLKSIDGIPLLLSFKGAGHVYFYERIGELPGTDSVIESRIMKPEWTSLSEPAYNHKCLQRSNLIQIETSP
jgi:hypothetical protein